MKNAQCTLSLEQHASLSLHADQLTNIYLSTCMGLWDLHALVPLQVTTQRRSPPRPGQKRRSLVTHKAHRSAHGPIGPT